MTKYLFIENSIKGKILVSIFLGFHTVGPVDAAQTSENAGIIKEFDTSIGGRPSSQKALIKKLSLPVKTAGYVTFCLDQKVFFGTYTSLRNLGTGNNLRIAQQVLQFSEGALSARTCESPDWTKISFIAFDSAVKDHWRKARKICMGSDVFYTYLSVDQIFGTQMSIIQSIANGQPEAC